MYNMIGGDTVSSVAGSPPATRTCPFGTDGRSEHTDLAMSMVRLQYRGGDLCRLQLTTLCK